MSVLLEKQSKKEHEKLIQKFYPNGCALTTLPNPTFDKNETWESYKKKCDEFEMDNK